MDAEPHWEKELPILVKCQKILQSDDFDAKVNQLIVHLSSQRLTGTLDTAFRLPDQRRRKPSQIFIGQLPTLSKHLLPLGPIQVTKECRRDPLPILPLLSCRDQPANSSQHRRATATKRKAPLPLRQSYRSCRSTVLLHTSTRTLIRLRPTQLYG